MRTIKLLAWLTVYYLGLGAILLTAWMIWPRIIDFLPIGGVEALINQPAGRTGHPCPVAPAAAEGCHCAARAVGGWRCAQHIAAGTPRGIG